MRWIALAIAIVVDTAHADTLSLDAPVAANLDRARVTIDHGRAVLALTLSSRDPELHVGSIGIRLPHGSRAIAMTAASVVATAMDSLDARATLSDVVTGRRDPALLEQSAGEPDRLVLRVFPIAKGAPMSVEIAIELPAIPAITIAAPIESPGSRSDVVALPRRSWMEGDSAARRFVDARTSLFAEAPARPAVPTVVIGNPVSMCECEAGPTPRTIRKWIHLETPRLRYCYERQLQRDRTLEGEADLHFTIQPDGHTSDIAIDGTLDNAEVTSCLAAEVAAWEFAQAGNPTRVNYPLRFQPVR
jgi:hypothetical protein